MTSTVTDISSSFVEGVKQVRGNLGNLTGGGSGGGFVNMQSPASSSGRASGRGSAGRKISGLGDSLKSLDSKYPHPKSDDVLDLSTLSVSEVSILNATLLWTQVGSENVRSGVVPTDDKNYGSSFPVTSIKGGETTRYSVPMESEDFNNARPVIEGLASLPYSNASGIERHRDPYDQSGYVNAISIHRGMALSKSVIDNLVPGAEFNAGPSQSWSMVPRVAMRFANQVSSRSGSGEQKKYAVTFNMPVSSIRRGSNISSIGILHEAEFLTSGSLRVLGIKTNDNGDYLVSVDQI